MPFFARGDDLCARQLRSSQMAHLATNGFVRSGHPTSESIPWAIFEHDPDVLQGAQELLDGVFPPLDRAQIFSDLLVMTHQSKSLMIKAEEVLRASRFAPMKKLFLVSRSFPLGSSLLQMASHVSYSNSGEIDDVVAKNVYLAGGNLNICLRHTAADMVKAALQRGLQEIHLHLLRPLLYDSDGGEMREWSSFESDYRRFYEQEWFLQVVRESRLQISQSDRANGIYVLKSSEGLQITVKVSFEDL